MAWVPLLVMRIAPVKPPLHWLPILYSQAAPAARLDEALLLTELDDEREETLEDTELDETEDELTLLDEALLTDELEAPTIPKGAG